MFFYLNCILASLSLLFQRFSHTTCVLDTLEDRNDTVAIAAASAGIIWLWHRLSNHQWCRALQVGAIVESQFDISLEMQSNVAPIGFSS